MARASAWVRASRGRRVDLGHHRHGGGQGYARGSSWMIAGRARADLGAVAHPVAVDVRIADPPPTLGGGVQPQPVDERFPEEREGISTTARPIPRELEAHVPAAAKPPTDRSPPPGSRSPAGRAGPARDACGSPPASADLLVGGQAGQNDAARTPSSSDPCGGARSPSGCRSSCPGTRARSAPAPQPRQVDGPQGPGIAQRRQVLEDHHPATGGSARPASASSRAARPCPRSGTT